MKYYILSALLLTGLGAHAQTPAFAPAKSYESGGSTPYSLAVGDVNSDGKPDIIIVNTYNSFIGVLLGNGDGTFRPVVTYYTGLAASPRAIAIVDINGDAKLDLVFSSISGSGMLGSLLGNGDGTFQAVTFYPSSGLHTPDYVATGDLNNDGKLDLISGSYNGGGNLGNVQVLLGKGNGSFQPPRLYDSGSIFQLVVTDVNGDGKQDVLTANVYNSSAGVLLGNGDGSLQAEVTYSTGNGSTPYAVAVADVNADSYPDLLTANFGTHTAGVLLGKGNGMFSPLTTYDAGSTSTPAGITAADINADGHVDLVTANFYDSSVGILLGKGDGTFRAPLVLGADSRPNEGANPFCVVAADVNRDGRLDLLTANYSSNSVGVFLQTSVLATRVIQQKLPISVAPNPASHTATLNGATAGAGVQVVDVMGHVVLTTQANEMGIAHLTLPSGIYLVRSGEGPILRLVVK